MENKSDGGTGTVIGFLAISAICIALALYSRSDRKYLYGDYDKVTNVLTIHTDKDCVCRHHKGRRVRLEKFNKHSYNYHIKVKYCEACCEGEDERVLDAMSDYNEKELY